MLNKRMVEKATFPTKIFTPEAKDLLSLLLERNPKDRLG